MDLVDVSWPVMFSGRLACLPLHRSFGAGRQGWPRDVGVAVRVVRELGACVGASGPLRSPAARLLHGFPRWSGSCELVVVDAGSRSGDGLAPALFGLAGIALFSCFLSPGFAQSGGLSRFCMWRSRSMCTLFKKTTPSFSSTSRSTRMASSWVVHARTFATAA